MKKIYGRTFTLGAYTTMALCLLGGVSAASRSLPTTDLGNIISNAEDSNVYAGLSYSPSWSRIVGFRIGALDGSTRAVYPHLHDGAALTSSSFNWNVQDPKIRFGNSMLFALEGGFGYREGNTRVEIEVGYKKFETRGYQARNRTQKEDTVYLLAKELPYNVVSGQTERLSHALAKVSAQDIAAFAQVVGHQAKNIDNKICNRKGGAWSNRQTEAYGAWSCDDLSYSDEIGRIKTPGYGLSYRFGNLHDHDVKYQGVEGYNAGRGWPGTTEKNIRTAEGMAEDLTSNLNADERSIIAGILSKTVSGAEIVEVRAITSASVTVNACYDLQSKCSLVIPFVCAGVGVNFIGIVEGHVNAKVAYKLKAGLSYKVTPVVTAFLAGFHNRVLGEDGYHDLPVQRMQDDISPKGRSKNYAVAKFKMAYTGAEFGVRLAF